MSHLMPQDSLAFMACLCQEMFLAIQDSRVHPTLGKFTRVNQVEVGSDFFLNHVGLQGTCRTLKNKHSVTMSLLTT